ncbi:MAG: zinc-binding alcohol dehydrogenase family protein [Acidobacteria bacterium]|nr:zinc-binding alcohol dehydrogenase family protein [Acidobacteriota bacterium]
MKALRFDRFGEISELRLVDVPKPTTKEPEGVLVEIRAASINPSDVKNVKGEMVGTTLPRIPGRDFAGIVVEGPASLVGTEVWGAGGDIGFTRDGCHAEFIVVPTRGVGPKPKTLSFEEAAAVGINFITAYHGLVHVGRIVPNDTVLVTGATGGVGSSVVQIAKWKGARVIAADRHPGDPEFVKQFRVDHTINTAVEDLEKSVAQYTNGCGATLAFDCVGGPLFEPCLKSLAQKGRQIAITSVVPRVSFNLLDFYHHRLTLHGVDTRPLDTVASAPILSDLAAGFEEGALHPPAVARRCRLEEAIDGYRVVASGALRGKIVIEND